jgi:protein-disulfide isomerase
VEGPADSKVTLIEYGDFECPACAVYAGFIERLAAEEATGTLRVVFRHFPLSQHPNALVAAQASEAAAAQGKFWEMYKLLYAGQDMWATLSDSAARDVFAGYAGMAGLDAAKFKTDIDSDAGKQLIQAELAEGEALGISYTPTIFVNGKAIDNPQSYEAFKAIIDAAAR